MLSYGFIQTSKLIFRSNHNFGHILQHPFNFCKIVNGAFLNWSGIFIYLGWCAEAAGHGDRLVCSEVYWFICGQLGVFLADHHSVVFVFANRDLKQEEVVKRTRRSTEGFPFKWNQFE